MGGTAGILIQVIISGLLMGGIYALVAVGLSLIWGVTEIVNFAHGEYMMIAMFGAYFGWECLGLDSTLSLPVVIVLMYFAGAISYKLLIRRTLKVGFIPQIFITFGLSIFLLAISQFLWTPNFKMIENPLISGKISIGGVYIVIAQLIGGLVAVGAVVTLTWFLKKTERGLALQATSENREWAALMGIDSDAMFSLSWGIGTACVAVAGVLMTNFFYIFPQVGGSFTLIAFIAVALGGFGSFYGTLLAALLIGLVESVGGYILGAQYKLAVVFVLYLIVIIRRPQGFFGRY